MLQGIGIRNYRGIADGKIEDLGRVNLFVGPNGSGKSTLLEAIFLGAMSSPSFVFGGVPIIQVRHNETTFPSMDCWFRKEAQHPVVITWRFGDGDKTLNIRSPQPASSSDWTGNTRMTQRYFGAMRLLDIRMLLSNLLERESYDNLIKPRADRMLRKVMNEVYELNIENFTYSAGEQVLQLLFSDRNYPLKVDDLGAGMRIALRLFISVLLCKDSGVLAEEFDGYQHIESFPRVVRTLCELSRQNNTQLFLATHSMETIRAFVDEATERPGTDLRIYQTTLSPDGVFQAAGLTADDAATLVAGGFDVRRSR